MEGLKEAVNDPKVQMLMAGAVGGISRIATGAASGENVWRSLAITVFVAAPFGSVAGNVVLSYGLPLSVGMFIAVVMGISCEKFVKALNEVQWGSLGHLGVSAVKRYLGRGGRG